jgi:hypothetical protein
MTIRWTALTLSIGIGLTLLADGARAAGLIVIAHPNVDLPAGEIKDDYIGEKQFAGAIKLVPVDNAVAQEEFLKHAMAMDPVKYNATWTKKGFRDGLNPPAIKSSDVEVYEFVKRTPGAIGYVTSAPQPGVAVIHKY